MEYILTKNGRGWLCRVDGFSCRGWGSRPDLAIRDWKEQKRRYDRLYPDQCA